LEALGEKIKYRAILVGVNLGKKSFFDPTLNELALLIESVGGIPVDRIVTRRAAPDPALFVGSGKAEEIKQMITLHNADCIVFDQVLSSAQQRNLEKYLNVAVLDRTLLILEIFSQRAQSHEGKLQVELAHLKYLSTRLVRRWSHLERQKGGAGLRGGPGETQIELDRRMIEQKIKTLKIALLKIKKQRSVQRRARIRNDLFRISLVGYTNSGKSTLFNALVKAEVLAADQLFATLDTKTKQLYLPEIDGQIALSDTVGFIRELPHTLIEAFEATLKESVDADLLLHVVDASSVSRTEQLQEVLRVLSEIGAGDVPQVLIFNKSDLLGPEQQPCETEDVYELRPGSLVPRFWISAKRGEGLSALKTSIAKIVQQQNNVIA
jgi:GTP-binding protein HflX